MLPLPLLTLPEASLSYFDAFSSSADPVSILNLINRKLSFDSSNEDLFSVLGAIRAQALNVAKSILAVDKPKNNLGTSEVLILQQILIYALFQEKKKRFDTHSEAAMTRMLELKTLLETPNPEANPPSPHIKPLKSYPKYDTLSIFTETSAWSDCNEITFRMLIFLAQQYPSLLRNMVASIHSNSHCGMSLSTISMLVADTVLNFFAQNKYEIFPALFDSIHATEEVFCSCMHMFYFLTYERMGYTMHLVPAVISKIQSRLRKIFSKTSGLSEFKTYCLKALKPSSTELSGDKKSFLISRIASQDLAEALEACNALLQLLDSEPADSASPSLEPGALPSSDGAKKTAKSTKVDDSPDKRKKKKSEPPPLFGWPSLKPFLPVLLSHVLQLGQYDNISFLVPHMISEARPLANTLLKLIRNYISNIPSGLSDIDAAVRTISKSNGTVQSNYSKLIEIIRLGNSNAACDALWILLPGISTDATLLTHLLSMEFITAFAPHFDILTHSNIELLEKIQWRLVDQYSAMANTPLDISKSDHQRLFSNLWNICFSESGRKLTGTVSKQWLLLGFDDENPTSMLRNRLPIHFMAYMKEKESEKLQNLLDSRLLMSSYDFKFARVMIDVSESTLSILILCLQQCHVVPLLISHSYAIEELFITLIVSFDAMWTQRGYNDTPDNYKACLKDILSAATQLLPSSRTISDLAVKLRQIVQQNVQVNNQLAIQKQPSYLDAIEMEYCTAQLKEGRATQGKRKAK